MQTALTKLKHYLFCSWAIVLRCFFVIIVCFIGYFALAVNDQGQDLILSIGDDDQSSSFFSYILRLQIGVIFWSVTLWYCSRLLLQLADLSSYNQYGIIKFIKWAPRIFGVFPFIVFVFALTTVNAPSNQVAYKLYIAAIILAIEAIVLLGIFSNQRSLWSKLKIKQYDNPYTSAAISFDSLWQLSGFKIFMIVWLSIIGVFFLLFLVSTSFAIFLKPGLIILSGMTLLTVVLSILSHFNDWRNRPVFLYLFFFISFCALFNDNTEIRNEPNASKTALRETVHTNFTNWVKYHKPQDSTKAVPMIFIATQGGGIRAMYWTAAVLAHLDYTYNGFYDHVYAISGVSGGGVGSVFYQTYYKDAILSGKVKRHELPSKIEGLTTGDFLSPVTSAFLFSDTFQKVIPWSITYFNRTRWLEDSWRDHYEATSKLGTYSMDSSFLNLWKLPDSMRYRLPSLLINGTVAETGQKIITSNLIIEEKYFRDVIDLEGEISCDVPVKTAASLCSRFPGITSSGLFISENKDKQGHIVDGGYAENTGIESMMSLYAGLRDSIKKINNTKVKIQPIFIFIKNSKESTKLKPIRVGIETRVPLSAFYNAWDRRAPIISKLASDYLNESDIVYFQIELDRNDSTIHLPLGWYLSEAAKKKIHDEAKDMLIRPRNANLKTLLDNSFK